MEHVAPKVAAAFAKASAEFTKVIMNKEGQSGASRKYPYADLGACIDAIKPALNKNELFLSQCVEQEIREGKLQDSLATYFIHSSGELLRFAIPFIVPHGATPQQFGSALTYGRRYGLCAAAGLFGEEDDDGASAETQGKGGGKPQSTAPKGQAPRNSQEKPAAPAAGGKAPSEAQLKRLYTIVSNAGWPKAEVSDLLGREFGITSSKELNMKQYDEVCLFVGTHPKPGFPKLVEAPPAA